MALLVFSFMACTVTHTQIVPFKAIQSDGASGVGKTPLSEGKGGKNQRCWMEQIEIQDAEAAPRWALL